MILSAIGKSHIVRMPITLHDVCHGVLAQSDLATDQAIAAALGDKSENLGCQSIRLRPLSELSTKPLTAGLRCSNSRANTFLDQLMLELGDAGDDRGEWKNLGLLVWSGDDLAGSVGELLSWNNGSSSRQGAVGERSRPSKWPISSGASLA